MARKSVLAKLIEAIRPRRVTAGNPYHKGAGPGGGQFTSGSTILQTNTPINLKLYHGGNLGGDYARGIWVSPDKEIALDYAQRVQGRSVQQINVNLVRPYVVAPEEYVTRARAMGAKSTSVADFSDIDKVMLAWARNNGHDGVIKAKHGEIFEVALFSANSIRGQMPAKGFAYQTPFKKWVKTLLEGEYSLAGAKSYHKEQVQKAVQSKLLVPPNVKAEYGL